MIALLLGACKNKSEQTEAGEFDYQALVSQYAEIEFVAYKIIFHIIKKKNF